MGITELRRKREERWDNLLHYAYSECDRKYSTSSTTQDEDRYLISELNAIRFGQDDYIENYMNNPIESSMTFKEYYISVSKLIPVKWFLSDSTTTGTFDDFFHEYNSLSILAGLNESTRQLIWLDIPRTFNVFIKKSTHFSFILSDEYRKAYYLAVLCRILSVTSCLLGGWYCQGMSFVAASYIFYYDEISSSLWKASCVPHENSFEVNLEDELFQIHEIYSCCTYYHLILQSNNLSALYEWSVFLTMYLEEFEYQLSETPETYPVYCHLQNLKYPIEFFSMEWFTTCFVLSTSYDVALHIQDMMIYANQSGTRVDILIRIGMAIVITLGPKILNFEDLESMQLEFRSLVLNLTPQQIIPTAIRYRIVKGSEQRDGSDLSDHILSRKFNRDSLLEHPSHLSENSEFIEWHRSRLITTIDMKGQRNVYSANTSVSIESTVNETIIDDASQCMIS